MIVKTIFTIGHSTHLVEKFIELLRQHEISVVVDVRSQPFSQYTPQFNKGSLNDSLKTHAVKYIFMGHELGARVDDASCYENVMVRGKNRNIARYSRMAQRPDFIAAINRLMKGAKTHNIALMCSEKEPLECHRTLLVAQALAKNSINITHIHSNGTLEQHQDALERLFKGIEATQDDLFLSRQQILNIAIKRQEEQIAYEDTTQEQNEYRKTA